jgi:hypothetical protein
MKKISQQALLNEAINLLKDKQACELQLLKSQFHITYESLKPINLIKNGLHEITASPDVKKTVINTAIGLATGYISKKVLIGATNNPIKKILGAVLEFTIANVVAKTANHTASIEEKST